MARKWVILGEHGVGTDAATCLAEIEVCCVCMSAKDNITGLINNAVLGIGGDIIKQLCDGMVCAFCGGCLLRADLIKYHKEFFVDCTCVVQETSKNLLDAFYASGMQGRTGSRLSCILGIGYINNFNMAIQ